MDISNLLQQGIAAAKAGQKVEARTLLMQVIEADERNEQGWLWLAGVVEDPNDMRTCLENVLALNPDHKQARKGLAWLDQRHGPVMAERVDPVQSEVVPDPQVTLSDVEPNPVTDPTIDLNQEQAKALWTPSSSDIRFTDIPAEVATAGSSQPAPAKHTIPAIVASEPDLPCPYCGAPTALAQRHCLKCKHDLEIRTQAEQKRSITLALFGGYYWLSGIIIILVGILFLIGAIFAYQMSRDPSIGSSSVSAAIFLTTLAVFLFVFGGGIIYVGWSLHQKARWAFYAACFFVGLSIISIFANMGIIAILLNYTKDLLSPEQIDEIRGNTGSSAACTTIIVFLQLALLGAVYREFFGQKQRFVPSFPINDHATHYHNGVAYKNRGMWYMAMREWEAAVGRAQNNVTYLHALGLAYAQLQRFDQARATLDKAITLAPNQSQLHESRQLIEKMAAKASYKSREQQNS